jgi:hypothetical protein
MEPPESPDAVRSPRRSFPATDPEPPRDRWRAIRRSVMPAVVVLAAGLGYLVYAHHSGPAARPAGRPPGPAATSIAAGFSGTVLAQLPGGELSLTSMSTGKAVVLKNLGAFGTISPEQVSPDGRYLVDPNSSRVISLASLAHPAAVSNGLTFPAPGTVQTQAYWSDHDTRIFLLSYASNGGSQTFPAGEVETVTTGSTSALHHLDGAVGDPLAAGAFVAVPGTRQPPPPQQGSAPDTALKLEDVGRPARLLATAATLARAAGLKPGSHVSVDPVPNPTGTMVAVTVFPAAAAGGGGGPGGIVVLSRSGKVLGTQTGGQFDIAWSASGRSLVTIGPGPADLLTLTWWPVGGPKAATTLDINEDDLTGCMWSPDGTAVLCGGAHRTWTLLRPGKQAVVFSGDGLPLAWLPGPARPA